LKEIAMNIRDIASTELCSPWDISKVLLKQHVKSREAVVRDR
jgi:hypothetical protein